MIAAPEAAPAVQPGAGLVSPGDAPEGALSLAKLRQQLSDYGSAKVEERKEAEVSRRYYHGDHWDSDEVRILNERGQPVITYNRIQRKVDGIVGTVERMRQDPKAFPRTPKHQAGADIASAVLNYVLDQNQWKSTSPYVAKDGAIEAMAGVELALEPGDNGDLDIGIYQLEPDTIFYDPRSSREDFSDASFIGIDKFVRLDDAIGMFPDFEGQLKDIGSQGYGGGTETLTDSERMQVWSKTEERSIRLVEHWYKVRGEWRYCFYCGDLRLADDVSPFLDNKGRTFCRFILYSNAVDHDNDRYGFVRNLKGPQDEINHRRSKGLHALNSRRLYINGIQLDPDEKHTLRGEINRVDGIIDVPPGSTIEEKDNANIISGNLEMMNEAKQEIENFGPSPSLVGGQGMGDSSGRAIQLLQQAALAEMGPFIITYRGWKLRIYRAIWDLVQRYWQAERWIRVTDDDGLAQFIQLNGLGFDPRTGQPTITNALGSLDVDIILDEGPDHVTLAEDTLQTLQAIAPGLAQAGKPIPPEIIIELANLPQATKAKLMGMLQQASQPDPQAQQMQQQAVALKMAGEAAKVDKTKAETMKLQADAQQTSVKTHVDAVDAEHTQAKTRKVTAEATTQEADNALRFMMPAVTPFGPVEQTFAQGPSSFPG